MMGTFQSWTRGLDIAIERVGSPDVTDRVSAARAYGWDLISYFSGPDSIRTQADRRDGDIVMLLGRDEDGQRLGGAAIFRMGWAARILPYDLSPPILTSPEDPEPIAGWFWTHFAIPTIVTPSTRAKRVLLNYESTDIDQIKPGRVGVLDGNRQLFSGGDIRVSETGFNGGIPKVGDAGDTADPDKLWVGDIGDRRRVYFGVEVAIRIELEDAMDNFVEIRGVGIEFEDDR